MKTIAGIIITLAAMYLTAYLLVAVRMTVYWWGFPTMIALIAIMGAGLALAIEPIVEALQ